MHTENGINTLAEDGRDVHQCARLSVIDNKDGNNHPSDEAALVTGYGDPHPEVTPPAILRKSPYQLKFVDEKGEDAPGRGDGDVSPQ